jgi:phosphohistidine phosphatase
MRTLPVREANAIVNLILWRHAEAEDASGQGGDWTRRDMARELTTRGQTQAKATAKWLAPRLEKNTVFLVSPAVRTIQTAQALGAEFTPRPELAPGATAQAVLEVANWGRAPGSTVVVVGHQPTLGQVASLLMSGVPVSWTVRKSGLWWFSSRHHDEHMQVVLQAVVNPDQF